MVNKREILQLLKDHFSFDYNSAKVSSDGLVTVNGDIQLLNLHYTRFEKLPVAFKAVTENLSLDENALVTLEGCPPELGVSFDCSRNMLKSLSGGPEIVGWNYYCDHNQLVDLKGAPVQIPNNFNCIGNPLKSLDGFPLKVENAAWLPYLPHLPLLRTLAARHIFLEPADDTHTVEKGKVQTILNKYAGQGKRAMFDCQKDLEDAGFEDHAKW
jgi:hypothetical protein